MKIAITGGTGFIGGHLAQRLAGEGHEVVLVARGPGRDKMEKQLVLSDLSDPVVLAEAFKDCEVVAHCAGINRELGTQTFQRVHIEGTTNVIAAAHSAGVRKVVLMSFLRARPNCGSPYHESKWKAEEILRNSGLEFTVVRSGMVYGRGDHMLDHLSRALYTFPMFALVGLREKAIRPLAVEDLIKVLNAAVVENRLNGKTVALTGPEQLYLSEAVSRVAGVVGKRPWMVRFPLWFHSALACLLEWTMQVPMVARAQVRILSEGVLESALPSDSLPCDLQPTIGFTKAQIRLGLPPAGAYNLRDLRCCC